MFVSQRDKPASVLFSQFKSTQQILALDLVILHKSFFIQISIFANFILIKIKIFTFTNEQTTNFHKYFWSNLMRIKKPT